MPASFFSGSTGGGTGLVVWSLTVWNENYYQQMGYNRLTGESEWIVMQLGVDTLGGRSLA